MRVQEEDIQQVAATYDLGEVRAFRRMPKGYSNANFKVETEKGDYIMRFCLSQDEEATRHEIKLMERLREEGFPAAYPLADKAGEYVQHQGEGKVMVYPFLEGEEPTMNPRSVAVIARANARLHGIPPITDPLRNNPMNLSMCESIITSFSSSLRQYPDVFEYFEEQTAHLAEALAPEVRDSLPQGFIHSDIFTDNTLFKGDELVAILDFEDACTDAFLVDIGITINGFCCPNNRLDESLMDIFLKEYQSVRPLTAAEKRWLPQYVQWGAHCMIAWHFHNVLQAENARKLRRVRELMERVRAMRGNMDD